MRDIFSLNKIWAQDKMYILVGTLLVKTFGLSLAVSTGIGFELQSAHFVDD
jgi:hypothetical protein